MDEGWTTLINDVEYTITGMIANGVEGDAICEDTKYKVYLTLVEKNKPKHYRDPVWLRNAYIEERRSMADIATEFDITTAAVNQWLVKHDIPTRDRGYKA